MKAKEYLEKAKQELLDEKNEKVVSEIKQRQKSIRSLKRTLKIVEKEFNEFLELDIEDIELDDLEY